MMRRVWLVGLLLSCIVLGEGFHLRSMEQQADVLYGLWDGAVYGVSDSELAYLKSLPVVESKGFQNQTGMIMEDGTGWGSIGWADDSFFDMANLRLKTGRLPENSSELAVEAVVLDGLGISYEAGQTVELDVAGADGSKRKISYTLVGVLENYSQYWNGEGDLLHFFTGKGMDPVSVNVFFQMADGFEGEAGRIHLEEHGVVTNENRRVITDPLAPENGVVTMLVSLLAGFCGLLLLQVLFDWEFVHRKELRILKILGCPSKLLVKNLGSLLVRCMAGPVLLVGICFVLSGLPAGWMIFLGALSILMVLVDLVLFLVMLWMSTTEKKKRRKIRSHSSRLVDVSEAARRLSVYLRPLYVMKLLLGVLCLVIVLFSSWRLVQDARDVDNTSLQDFLIMGKSQLSSRYQQGQTNWIDDESRDIEKSVLERIALAGDLEILKQDRQVQARVSWPHMDKALFADEKTGLPDERWGLLVQPDQEGIPSLYRPVTETAWMPFVQQLKDSVSEGSVDWDKWSQGEEAIVSLPPVVLGETEVYGSWKGRIDESLRVGDVIALEMPDGTKTLPVTGIIRSDFSLPVYGVYLGGDRVNRVQLALKSRENRVPAELFLSRITSENDLVFNNVAQWTSVRLQSLRMDMVLQAGMILFAVSMELYGVLFIRRLAADRKRSYLERFVRAGVPEDIVMEVDRKNRHRQWIMGMAVIGLVGFFMTVWMAFSYVGPQFPWVQILIGILITMLTGFTMVRA